MKQYPTDPIRAFKRQAAAARRTGDNTSCACGESQARALQGNTGVCAECQRKAKGHTIMDKHHVAGRANSSTTVAIPTNDHRALLSDAQYDWPKTTLENPQGDPLLAAAACIRGFMDTVLYLIDKLLRWIAEMLELLSAVLVARLGPQWWNDTALAQYAGKGKK